MKNLKSILIAVGVTFLISELISAQDTTWKFRSYWREVISDSVFAQDTTITIKTSAECGSCKKRIENNMAFEKGVKKATLDVASKILTITYDPRKNTPERLRQVVAKTGYDADDVPADAKAYKKLPKCCQKGEMEGK